MAMTLKLDYKGSNIINWAPGKEQWWITGFNYKYQKANRDNLKATYTVKFNNQQMFNGFKKKINENKETRWQINYYENPCTLVF